MTLTRVERIVNAIRQLSKDEMVALREHLYGGPVAEEKAEETVEETAEETVEEKAVEKTSPKRKTRLGVTGTIRDFPPPEPYDDRKY